MNSHNNYYYSSSVMINQNGNTQFQRQTHTQKIENGKKIDNYNYTQLIQYNNKPYLLNINKHNNQDIKISVIEPTTQKIILEKKVNEDKLESTISNLENLLKKSSNKLSNKTSRKTSRKSHNKLTKSQREKKLNQMKKKSQLFQNIKSIPIIKNKKNKKSKKSKNKP